MEERSQFKNPAEEIQYLEQKILEKKKELGENKETRALVSDIIKEHTFGDVVSPAPLLQQSVTPSRDLAKDVALFVQLAFRDGVASAVGKARATHNPYLLDAFHDALVDRFLSDLISRGLLPPHG